jgi:hypothetical protein
MDGLGMMTGLFVCAWNTEHEDETEKHLLGQGSQKFLE